MDREIWFERPHNFNNVIPVHPKGWRALWLYVGGMIASLILPLFLLIGAMHALGLTTPRPHGGLSAPLWPIAVLTAVWMFAVMIPASRAFRRFVYARTRVCTPD